MSNFEQPGKPIQPDPSAANDSGTNPFAGESATSQSNHGIPTAYHQSGPPGKKSSTKLVLSIIGGCVLIGVLLIVGCGFVFYRYLFVDSANTKTVTSSDGITQLQVPSNWSTGMSLNEDASINACNIFGERYAIVITESKTDFQDTDVNDLIDYGDIVIDMMRDNYLGMQTSVDQDSFLTNGMNSKRFRISGTMDGVDATMWLTVVEGRRHYHQVLVWTLSSRASSNRQSLLDVSASFVER